MKRLKINYKLEIVTNIPEILAAFEKRGNAAADFQFEILVRKYCDSLPVRDYVGTKHVRSNALAVFKWCKEHVKSYPNYYYLAKIRQDGTHKNDSELVQIGNPTAHLHNQ